MLGKQETIPIAFLIVKEDTS